MRVAADTNWLVAAYFVENDRPRADIVARFAVRYDTPLLVSPPVLLESQNVFASIAASANPPEWQRLLREVGKKLIVPQLAWDTIAVEARQLFQRFSHKAPFSTFDAMILASALRSEASHFLSFDRNSNLRALAAVLKLKVFPELTADDKRRMAAFR